MPVLFISPSSPGMISLGNEFSYLSRFCSIKKNLVIRSGRLIVSNANSSALVGFFCYQFLQLNFMRGSEARGMLLEASHTRHLF